MKKYSIKKAGKDFSFNQEINNKGSREKRVIIDNRGHKAIFKYQMKDRICSEACSEKMSYEIARAIGYKCAKIELAIDEENTIGVLNYLFVNTLEEEHIDAVDYIKKNNEKREEFYTIENIKKCLDKIDKKLFENFLKIILFDALTGEQDRHEENWGVTRKNGKYKLSPLYDNGCNLLKDFYDINYAEKYYSGQKDFQAYIKRSKSSIRDNNGKKYNHFKLVEEMYKKYPNIMSKEIKNLKKLKDSIIEKIVNGIPNELMSEQQKKFVIKYIKIRRDSLMNIIKGK